MKRPVTASERFAFYSGAPTSRGCHEWDGSRDRRGYGSLSVDGKRRAATHFALELAGKPRPSEKHFACHACDNPPCVNPDHLWWGTHVENMRDCAAKGRFNLTGLSIGWATGRPAKSIEDRFAGLIDRRGDHECWIYRGKIERDGYGIFDVGRGTGKHYRAHRLAYELSVGPIPTDGRIRHSCGVRHCVNPAHLVLKLKRVRLTA